MDLDDDTIEQAVRICERKKAYFLSTELRPLLEGDTDSEDIGELLWDVFRTGEVDFDEQQYAHMLADAPGAYEANDVIDVIEEFAEHYGSDGSMPTDYGSTRLWNDDDLPGYFKGMFDLLTSKGDDEEVLEEIAGRRNELPSPYDEAVAYALSQMGHLSYEALPEDLLETAVTLVLENRYTPEPTWRKPSVWPEDVWEKALADVARESDVEIEEPNHLETIIAHATPADIVDLANRVSQSGVWDLVDVLTSYGDDALEPIEEALSEHEDEKAWPSFPLRIAHLKLCEARNDTTPSKIVEVARPLTYKAAVWKGIDALVSHGEALVEPLEEALRDLDDSPDAPGYDEPWPAFTLGMAYLELCRKLDRTPSPDVDHLFESLAAHYTPPTSKSQPRDRILEALSTFPSERLASILLVPDDLNLWLVDAASSNSEVLSRFVERVTSDEYFGWEEQEGLESAIASLGADGLPAYREMLAGDDFDEEKDVVEILADLQEDALAPALAVALTDRRKTFREPARDGLLELSEEAVLDALDAPLHGSRKHMRLAAAKVLAELPESERRYELARERLEAERTQDVQDVLESIEPPTDEDDEPDFDRDAIFEAIDEDVSNWREFTDEVGVELIHLLGAHHEQDKYGWLDYDSQDLLCHAVEYFADEPEAAEYAVDILHQVDTHARALLDKFHERLDGFLEEAHRRLIDTAELEKTPYLEEQDVVEWIAGEVPEDGKDALLELLGDRRKTIRRPASEGLASLGEPVAEEVWQVLLDDDTRADGREGAARTLAKIRSPEAIPHLEEAKEGERSGRVEEAIEAALFACRNASIEVPEIEDDGELDDALAELNLERPEPFPDELPVLHWADSGEKLSEGATDWVLAKLFREDQETHDEQLLEVRERLDGGDCHELCDALLEAAPYDDRGWGLYIQPVIGSADHIDALGEKLEDLASSSLTNWGTDGVEAMVRHGSDTAVQWLDRSVRKTSQDPLRDRARDGLQRLADTRDMSVDDLVLKTTPDFGFDRSGEQRVDYGSRDIVVRLDPENGLEFEDDKGKVRDWFPTPRKADDDEKVQAAKNQFRGMKRRIKQITQALSERLEEAMITGRTRPFEEWQQLFVDHPIAFSLTRRLVFEARDEDADAPIRFAVSREGTFLDVEGLPADVPEERDIGLVHPVDLSDDTLDAWREHLEMRDVHPPCPQLEREVYPREEMPDTKKELWLEFPQVETRTFMGRLDDAGYERGPREEAGMIGKAVRQIGPYQIEFHHDGYSPQAPDAGGDLDIDGLSIWRKKDSEESDVQHDRTILHFEEVSDRLASEIVRDLELLTKGE